MSKSAEAFLRIENISKAYGVVQALDNVSFSIEKGEIHTLLGENGAGKSTLVKIIKGEVIPDSGEIFLDSNRIQEYSPQYAQNLGISMVHQELALFENMTVANNIFPTRDFKNKLGLMNEKAMNAEAKKNIDEFGIDISPNQKLGDLTLAQQQIVEILRCIAHGQKLILLDEPTSGLNNNEVERLMEIIRKLKKRGKTIIYISHRISEIMNISDKITVLRDGRYIDTIDMSNKVTEMQLVSMMVGKDLTSGLYSRKEYKDLSNAETIIEVKKLGRKNSVQDISFSVKKGEVLGFFGLEGSGVTEISKMIYGLDYSDTGEVIIRGKKLKTIAPHIMVDNGVLYLYNNRKIAGLLQESTTVQNMSIPVVDDLSKHGFVKEKKMVAHAEKFVKSFSIVLPSVYAKPKSLSGGNQQKLMLSICLGKQPDCLILNEPTRGIDVNAKAQIHKFILDLVEKGISIVLFSSELPEFLALADKVIIMKRKRVSGELEKDKITSNNIMTCAASDI